MNIDDITKEYTAEFEKFSLPSLGAPLFIKILDFKKIFETQKKEFKKEHKEKLVLSIVNSFNTGFDIAYNFVTRFDLLENSLKKDGITVDEFDIKIPCMVAIEKIKSLSKIGEIIIYSFNTGVDFALKEDQEKKRKEKEEKRKEEELKKNKTKETKKRKSREGKKPLSGYFEPDFIKQFKIIAAEKNVTIQALLGEAVDDFIKKQE